MKIAFGPRKSSWVEAEQAITDQPSEKGPGLWALLFSLQLPIALEELFTAVLFHTQDVLPLSCSQSSPGFLLAFELTPRTMVDNNGIISQ